jgi:transcription initiation factor TFIIIB Brf1 subunit/transcription initiation factor TFIIB
MTDLFPGLAKKIEILDEDLRLRAYLFDITRRETTNISEKTDAEAAAAKQAEDEDGAWVCDNCETDEHVQTIEDAVLCVRCGEVFEHILDQGPEYRWFSGDDRNPDPTRVGAPQNPLLPESSLGTTMILRKHHGNAMRKIKRYHTWNLMPYRERNLWGIFEGLHVRAINAGIGVGVLEEAKRLYAQLSALCVCRGTQKEALLAACLYESLKRSGTPRRPKDIGVIFQINIRYVTKGLKQFANLLDLDERIGIKTSNLKDAKKALKVAASAAAAASVAAASAAATAAADAGLTYEPPVEAEVESAAAANVAPLPIVPAIRPQVSVESRRARWDKISRSTTTFEHYIEPFVSKLEAPRQLTGTLMAITHQICSRADDMGICPENTPPSLTAAALALACNSLSIQKSIQDIASVCDISVVTLHKCLKRLDQWKQKLLETK